MVFLATWMRPAQAANPAQGPGGPILVLTSGNANFGNYYAEILRNEGFNAFTVADVASISAATLSAYDVVILAKAALTDAQVNRLTSWVQGGGNLIAMAPVPKLAPLLGLSGTGNTVSEGYLLVNTGHAVGNGIVNQTMQYHGAARRYTLNGATALATLYSSATKATANPAVTLHSVGSGRTAAFAYDLATSVVYMRQGNPAWATQERDGLAPIRSDDKFYGNAAADPKPDWVDLSKVAIPQADEQQRLLANLITHMNLARKPLPRFWYFPHGHKAVVIMTGDDHANGGTPGRFDRLRAQSPAGCSVADWQCVRGTSYIFTDTALSPEAAAQYTAEGFEVSLHASTRCDDYTALSLDSVYTEQLAAFRAKYAGLPAPATQRHHCIVWSDWSSGAEVQAKHGMRLDTSYYYWPAGWVRNVAGIFTGSAMPQRFMRLDGAFVDVYQAATQMTDESGQAYPATVDTLLDRALGAEGYYGAYTVNAHTDQAITVESETVVASALARGVPVVSARQMLTWLDARNASAFSGLSWNGSALAFTVSSDPNARGLQGMVPVRSASGVLNVLQRGTATVPFTVKAIKGVEYAFFPAAAGSYVARYGADATGPTVTATTPAAGATGVNTAASVTATFGEALDPATVTASTFLLRDPAGTAVPATVRWDAATRTATLRPSVALQPSTRYTARLRGAALDPRIEDAAGNPLAATMAWSFTTGAGPGADCPCSGWSPAATPAMPSVNDPGAVEVGVKFRVDIAGYITGIRFYKGAGNTGTHLGSLWNGSGTRLASAEFINETASGWQQVSFATPVPVAANTVYVASYFAPNGRYAADNNFFAGAGVNQGVVHLLQDGVSGGNGVYAYGSTSTFPAQSYLATNYWVDIVFTPNTATAGTTAPGAIGVAAAPVPAPAPAVARAVTIDPKLFQSVAAGAGERLEAAAAVAAAADSCTAPANAIVAENCKAGSPASEWQVSGAGDASLQGFATEMSVNRGGTINFKVDTNASNYRFDIYRLGWYGGLGARKVASVNPTATLPQSQPACLTQASTGLVDCGNWAVSGAWTVPAGAVSGIYVARLVRPDTGGASHIVFVVRDDAGTHDMLFQTSDTTWQAYNSYGGSSLYSGGIGTGAGRAYKVSYNRPFNTRAVAGGQDWLFHAEYPMVRWLEANGYDLGYISGIDTDRAGAQLLRAKAFLSVGHDEYWSGTQRANVEAARDAGVSLAFFSGNEVFWKTRWENSIDGSGTPYRTLVSYKETHANAKIDPSPVWTGTWRDPRFSPPADGGRPENALTGTIFMNNDTGSSYAIKVPAADGKMRFWRNTGIATLAAGTTATLPTGVLGYEWDADLDNGARPPGLIRLSQTTLTTGGALLDYGSTFGTGTVTHRLTLYRHASRAWVFGAGTIQWSWGLDPTHDNAGTPADRRMRQATVNLFADMGVQPATLQSPLVAATASTDAARPTSAITAPAAGASVPAGQAVTIRGTASDSGGVVGGVEVSTDNGATWHPANGRGSWTYAWTPKATGTFTIRSRAVDDSGNLQGTPASRSITVTPMVCPCTAFSAADTPTTPSDPDAATVNVGVKFRVDQNGFVTAVRFYKGSGNTGTHVGALWRADGTLLATATFVNETATGWQQANFSSPVPVTAGTVYVASYRAPNGHYAGDNGFFSSAGVDSGPIHLLRDGESGGNGVYAYGGDSVLFPASSFQGTNYWVDVVFRP
ncbi:N,N-dimethylformamidase beta subunit family domain-containing protein [Azohydromonas australica]|uniref:N,N-dimethylformamidase beta subunit family domain-containing protein n=1 Tax=Azohydromonas australica TaxID=364039 RepID=UPI000685E556|nr:N,N-dimethylformamidase beta subunit family domain-containing protein [Azohydromonas australica]